MSATITLSNPCTSRPDGIRRTQWARPSGCNGWPTSTAFPHGIVARATLDAPDVEQILEGHARHKNVRGIRHAINWHPDPAKTYVNRPDLIRTDAWRRGFGLLRRFGLSFDLQLYPAQMADAAALAHANPDVLIILNHAGMPVDRNEEGTSPLAARHAGTGRRRQCGCEDLRAGNSRSGTGR